jgi:hypothetical protein
MRPAHECTCWRAKTAEGVSHPAAWLTSHERIAVAATDGYHVEGRPAGMVWYPSDGGTATPGLTVEMDDGSEVDLPVTEIETITPLLTTDAAAAAAQVTEALTQPFGIPDDGIEAVVLAGEHDVVEVRVTRRHVPCDAMTPPEPRIFFTIVEQHGPPVG